MEVNTVHAGDLMVPASFGQRRLWFFDRLQPGSSLYNVQLVKTLSGTPDVAALQRALDAMMIRHDVLRTTFADVDGLPMQMVHAEMAVAVSVTDLSSRPEDSRARDVHRLIQDELTHGFDLGRGPLVRVVMIRIGAHHAMVSACVHHIIFDDWSRDIFAREFFALYDDFRTGRAPSLPAQTAHYAAYAAAQHARFDGGSLDPQLNYWRERLRGLPRTTEMPTDRPRPAAQTFGGATRGFSLDMATGLGFRELTRSAGATLFMSLFAVYAVLLSRHAGQTDLAVGTPVADRGRPELANQIGFFVNTLVLRVDLSDDPSFLTLLARVRETATGALAHQDVPFERIVEDLRPERDPSRQPVFQTMFVYQYGQAGADDEEPEDGVASGAKFDLTLTATDAAPRIRGSFDYNTDLFSPDTIARFGERFGALVAAVVAEPHRPVSELPMLSAMERATIVTRWNATDAPLPPRPLAHEIVAAVAASRPHLPALAVDGADMSYGELDRRAGALAARLVRLGVGPEVRVGLCAERSAGWVTAMLGCLKAGGAMVPLDPSLPPDRLRFMIEDAGVALVLTEAGSDEGLEGVAAELVYVDVPAPAAPLDALPKVGPDTLAYVVYTSGSTGRPKGVMVEQASLANLALAQGRFWAVGEGSRVLQFAAPGFDAAMSEVFSTLCLGGCLVLVPPAETMPGQSLRETLRRERITHVTLPPSALAAMPSDGLSDLRLVVSAGEACDPALARRWANGRRVVNAYGPTEITVCATMQDEEGSDSFPIGRPIANMRVYVLDRHGKPVPPGVAGEIHIGGIGVARGYLGRPELTAERFVPDTVSGRPGRLYRTGDLGRFDGAGTLHYLGRMDRQLKIRGYRIEPGEVESVLRQHPQVADAAVVGLGSGPEARLIAYVIPDGTAPLAVALRGFVAGSLPDYMAPAAYVMVERWPRTPNGKIDHAALPRPDVLTRESATAYAAPEGETERTVAAIWRDCLNVKEVGVDDNFFDLGGHSLLLVKVHGRLREELKADLSLVDLFRFPTVRLLAGALRTSAAGRQGTEAKALARADQRAAQQNAARLQRRRRSPGETHA